MGWSGEITLGGEPRPGSSPSATKWGDGTIGVYFFDINNHLRFQDGYGNNWSGVGDTGIVIDPPDPRTGIVVSPAAVSSGGGLQIFYMGRNNGLWVILVG